MLQSAAQELPCSSRTVSLHPFPFGLQLKSSEFEMNESHGVTSRAADAHGSLKWPFASNQFAAPRAPRDPELEFGNVDEASLRGHGRWQQRTVSEYVSCLQ